MNLNEKIAAFEEMVQKIKAREPQNVEKQHEAGKLTAGERIDMLFDKGTFVETGMFAQHQYHDFDLERNHLYRDRPYRDGVITGFGKINDRLAYAFAQDFTTMGGSVGFTHSKKICETICAARKNKAPIIGLIDSAGARIQEGSGAYASIFYENILTSGVVPQISVIMGICAGGGVCSSALTDFIFMVEGTSSMFVASPAVLKEVTGEKITSEELGGAEVHSTISGVCDFVAKNDEDCIEMVKKLLTYLPSSFLKEPPWIDTEDSPDRSSPELLEIVPVDSRTSFDMRKIISFIVDNNDFFEVKNNFASNIITGFARLGGYSVGICANQPLTYAGTINCNASDKAAKFYRTCDCYNIPIITLVDVPGYMPGISEEYKGIIRHGAKMLYGYTEASVPKITCIIRKAYGGSYAAMGCKAMGADIVFAWPTTEIATMGAESAVNVLYKKELEKSEDKSALFRQRVQEYREKFSTPFYYASRLDVDVIIDPRETRKQLITALENTKDKKVKKIEKKHGNIPL
ncbi:methylmalonyl-CoA carboxyltransferase [Peptococcaceae bacterium SCADC1_2_3]|jgi:acetyl-CoA carboxylase carboxyltransferase component|nr:methylmalonyl-CoA carboxyltransferase [Peptococcaceae bacterium SCADC1_2_3]KFI35515.1 methylmalonyl-CoA carboxyltransferase [Peptococcaceae bacterium SCADC1_2_3]